MAIQIEPDTFYSADEVAALTGMSKANLALWRTKGVGPTYSKLGRSVWYRGADLLSFIEKGRRRSTLEDGRPHVQADARGKGPTRAA